MGQVDGKVAIITGGASGIGAACARTLAREGANVVVTDVDDQRGRALVREITAGGGEAVFFVQDVTDEPRWNAVVGEIERRYGRLDVLVANAGIAVGSPSIIDMSLADWRRQLAVNLDGVFLSVKYAIPVMRRAGGGSIVMMSSVAGLRGAATLAAYCVTKGGVRLFAKALAMECAGAGDCIRVNSVHPGIIDTPIWYKMGRNDPLGPHEMAQLAVPLGRAGAPQDVANCVLFLASDASSYMTGAEIVIDGGMSGGAVRRPAATNAEPRAVRAG
jgi:NAD(P)-dependent dehydrogenase (short-subunit alcohol dehydrogenase family)